MKNESKPFNPLLAKMFFLIRYIEKWGRGTIDMIEDTHDHGLPEPEFKDTGTAIVIIFRKKMNEELLREKGLNDRQIKALKYLEEHEKITNREYREINDASRQTAKRDLSNLVERGLLKQKGKGKGTYYTL